MGNELKRAIIVVVAAVAAAAVFWAAERPISGQANVQFPASYRAPRTADGKPDFNGIWQAMVTANWDLLAHSTAPGPENARLGAYSAQPAGQSIVEGDEIPYRPEMLAKKKENFEKRMTADPFNRDVGDPEVKCFMPGVPRATYMPYAFQILQSTNKILIAYEYATANRIVSLDKVEPAPIDSWMGHSVGRFDGDTLVVTATDFNASSWFSRAGDFHSEALKVTERYTPVSPYHLMYEATIEDPEVFSRPWKISFPLYRRMEKSVQLLEFKCVEFSEEFLYGSFRKQTK